MIKEVSFLLISLKLSKFIFKAPLVPYDNNFCDILLYLQEAPQFSKQKMLSL